MEGDKQPYHHGDLRNALVLFALRAVETGGVKTVSLREAARHIGVSPSAVYRHFADKDALIQAVIDDGLSRMARAMDHAARVARERTMGADVSAAVLTATVVSMVRFAAAHPAHFRMLISALNEKRSAPRQMVEGAVEKVLSAGFSAAERRNARRAIWAASLGVGVQAAFDTDRTHEASVWEGICKTTLDTALLGALHGDGLSAEHECPRLPGLQRDEGMGVSAKERSAEARGAAVTGKGDGVSSARPSKGR
ncbi:MAG: TetR/AcrR family transcriptional regulator [Polyangiaceae bacterium]|nr:TetR/AcrR family transcriptional regulator [Polyangiaceae bacterium]